MYCFVMFFVLLNGRTAFGEALRKPKGPWSVLVNNQKVIMSPVSNAQYNEQGEYSYREGELVNITCQRPKGVMHIEFQMFDGKDHNLPKKHTTMKSEKNQHLNIILTKHFDGYYVTVIFTYNILETSEYIVRLNFNMISNKAKPAISFSVHDMELAPSWNGSEVYYTYEYYNGEKVSIKSKAPTKYKGSKCSTKTNLNVPNMHANCHLPISISAVLHSDHSEQMIAFDLDPDIVYLVFIYVGSDVPYPTIFGLPQKGVKLKYNKSFSNQNIQYSHEIRENYLELLCQSPWIKNNCTWIYDKTIANATATESTNIKLNIDLQNMSNTTVTCDCSEKYWSTVEILNVSENSYHEETDIISDGAQEFHQPADIGSLPSETKPPENKLDGFSFQSIVDWKVLGAIVVAALLVVFLVAFMIVRVLKRKRKREVAQDSAINYETLPAHGEGEMPMPTQWDTYAKAHDHQEDDHTYSVPHVEKNIEDMYAKPQSKSERRRPAPIESDYAVVGSESGYAEVNLTGAKAPGSEYANVQEQQKPLPGYGIIKPKLGPQVLPKTNAVAYAQAVPKNQRNETGYHNVFQNQRYANTTSNDKLTEYAEPTYCEPAYCEVNLKNK